VQITALAIAAALAFWVTTAAHAYARQQNLHDADQWYRRGEQALMAGDHAGAVDALRRAVARNRADRKYALALAHAFVTANDPDAAERVLLSLRDTTPEDVDVNLALARLNAARGAAEDAVRYFRNALYAPAAAADVELRRSTRLELIRYLLASDDRGRASVELLAAANDSPNDPTSALELGRLFINAGDDRRALDQFQIALRGAPQNADALTAAGAAAFRLARYQDAQRYLAAAPPTEANRKLLAAATGVLTLDPSAPRLSTNERRTRLLSGLDAVESRLMTCAPTVDTSAELRELRMFSADLRRRARVDSETIDHGMDLIGRGEHAAAACREESPTDRALVLIVANSAPR
jgi:Flp pilus assembly protein TadD